MGSLVVSHVHLCCVRLSRSFAVMSSIRGRGRCVCVCFFFLLSMSMASMLWQWL